MTEKPVYILGGGIAGLTTANYLVQNGIRCCILDQDPILGGHGRNWACMATDQCQSCSCCLVEETIQELEKSKFIEVMAGWKAVSIEPKSLDKLVVLENAETGETRSVEARALVIATGFQPYNPSEKILLGYGNHSGVFSLPELTSIIKSDNLTNFVPEKEELKAAFFQCVGSRDIGIGANYCSQYCCGTALRMAIKLAHEFPGAQITIFYIDLQIAGKTAAKLFKAAENAKIKLRQGVPGEINQTEQGTLEVVVEEEGCNVKKQFNRIILSVGQHPAGTQFVNSVITLNEFGFFQPVDTFLGSRTEVPGIYLAGTCTGPKDIRQTIEHAGQTAQIVLSDIANGRLK